VALVDGGPEGLLHGGWPLLERGDLAEALWAQANEPGAVLGAGRRPWGPAETARALEVLAQEGVDVLVGIGGNGTMALLDELAARGARVVGVAKTIDNDVAGTDRAPGYRSAASFVARAFRALGADLQAMRGFEDVRVVEVMGRRAGWLVGAAVAGDPDVLVLPPERPVEWDGLLAEVRRRHAERGSVLLAVGEGVRDAEGHELGSMALDAQGRTRVYGRAAAVVAERIRQDLGLAVRAESLGFLPRCFWATRDDRREARRVGRLAAAQACAGASGVMIGLSREGEPVAVPLREVAGRERTLPAAFLDFGPAWRAWLDPLLDDGPVG